MSNTGGHGGAREGTQRRQPGRSAVGRPRAFGILRLASSIPARLDLARQTQPILDDLAARIDETIKVAIVREKYAVNVQQAMSSAAVASQNRVGQLTPLHATASGKVLLAYSSKEQPAGSADPALAPSDRPDEKVIWVMKNRGNPLT